MKNEQSLNDCYFQLQMVRLRRRKQMFQIPEDIIYILHSVVVEWWELNGRRARSGQSMPNTRWETIQNGQDWSISVKSSETGNKTNIQWWKKN